VLLAVLLLLGSPSPPLDQPLVCFTLISWLVPPSSDSDLELHLCSDFLLMVLGHYSGCWFGYCSMAAG
jgi:hypothetical protein